MFLYDDLKMRVVRYTPNPYGSRKPIYAKCNSIELLRSGRIDLFADGHCIELHPPVIFWMKRGHTYTLDVLPDPEGKQGEHIFCDCSGAISDQFIQYLDRHCPEKHFTPTPKGLEKINRVFDKMLSLYREDLIRFRPELIGNFTTLMLLIQKERTPLTTPDKDPYKINLLANEIRSNPFQNFDFEEIAANQGITYEHYRRLFRQILHVTPMEFVRLQKAGHAAELLSHTNMRIKEIMDRCQYKSLFDFSRAFKKQYGVSPREYRKKN